jgi:hypothetical protein
MSRSGFYYAVQAMERVAAGTAADGVPDVPARRAAARQAPASAHTEGSIVSLRRRVLAAVRLPVGSARHRVRRGGRRLGGTARAE